MKTFKKFLDEQFKMDKKIYDNQFHSHPKLDDIKKNYHHESLGTSEGYHITHIPKYKKKPGVKRYHGEAIFLHDKDGTSAGKIEYEQVDKKNPKDVMTGNTFLHSKHQGKKIMDKVYKHLQNNGFTLHPGRDQTRGGESIWKRLHNANK